MDIEISHRNIGPSVSSRALYLALGHKPNNWTRWYTANILNNPFAVAGVDYIRLPQLLSESSGDLQGEGLKARRFAADFPVTLGFAKKLCMLSRSEKGEQIRDYFLECERRLGEPEKKSTEIAIRVETKPALPGTYLDALKALVSSEESKLRLSERNEALELRARAQDEVLAANQPKVEFYDTLTQSGDAVDVKTAAKMLKLPYGQKTLFQKLRELKLLMSSNQPFQRYIDFGWFTIHTTTWKDPEGETHIYNQTLVTMKGLAAIKRAMNILESD